jgi:hypothetical protein
MTKPLWKYYNCSNKIVHAEKIIKILNIGVKIFALGQAEVCFFVNKCKKKT